MKKLIDFFIDRSLLVNLFTVMVILVGAISLYNLQKETFPKVEFDVILVSTIYPGSSSEDVEKLVTIPIERELKGVDGIKELNALSAENRSIIYLEIDPDADLEEVTDDVKTAIDAVDDLPLDVEVPRVTSLDNKRRGILKVALTGGTYNELRTISKRLRDKLERMKELAAVDLDGYRVDEIRVELDPVKMNQYEVSISEVYSSLQTRNLNLSAGNIESEDGDIMVRTVAEFESANDIENVVIRSNNSGNKVLVKDIAVVTRGPTKGSILQRSNGKRAIFLDIKAKESADILGTTDKLKKNIEAFFASGKYPQISFRFTDDLSYYVKRRLNILKDNGLIGIGLVFLCLLLFLNFRTSVVTSLGAPIAFMVSFVVMDGMGLSLNLISMFALILVLGMLVDDSIIVAEHFYQKLEKGMDPKKAAREASYETIKPVTATILTTIVAFGSLFFMGGIMGKFLWPVPAVVIICLIASLFECFFILPSHLADFCKLSKNHKLEEKRWYDRLTDLYGRNLNWFVKKPWIILVSFFFLWVGSLVVAKKFMDFELFPGDDVRTVLIQVKGGVGNPLNKTDLAMKEMETIALKDLKKEEFEQVKTQVGVLVGDQGAKTGSHYGSLILYLTPPDERGRSTDEIVNSITDKQKALLGPQGYTVTVKKIQGGPPKGKPVDIEIAGDDLAELKAAAKRIDTLLTKEPGITSTEIDFEEGKEQVVINVNDAEVRRLGLTTQDVALELRRVLSGDALTEIRESDEDIEIKLFLSDDAIGKVESLKLLHLTNRQGNRIPLAKVVDFKTLPGAFVIRRLDRKRVISVSASIDKSKTTPVKVAQTFKGKVDGVLADYPDLTYEFGGENKDTKESMGRLLKSGVIAMFCIFIILVVMFNSLMHPVVVMAAIPLGLIGVIMTFFVANQALGFMALMGVVALIGVVVNDSIVLVTFINQKRRELGEDRLVEAVVEASKSRFRPVVLTTFTTVAGLLPIAHPIVSKVLSLGKTVDSDPFLQPMAMSFAWGLLFASLVTLMFIPCNYIVFEKIKSWFVRKFFKKSGLLRSRTEGSQEPSTTGA